MPTSNSPTTRKIYEDDPEILAMSDAEIKAAVDDMAGAWAGRDDIPENWLENLRSGWDERLDDLYGPNPR